jgi:hypothetical protein
MTQRVTSLTEFSLRSSVETVSTFSPANDSPTRASIPGRRLLKGLRFRQVHLDFHTSEHIPGVGSQFDPKAFVETLKSAHVDSVTLFSRCHHGWIYHETKFPNRHPHLTCNLLEEQIEACHSAGILCPIYVTVGWDEYAARQNPGWVEIDAQGKRIGRGPLEKSWGWQKLDFASPYVDYVLAQVSEVIDLFGDKIDGFFFDIIHQFGVHSAWCMAEYEVRGWDPTNLDHQARLRQELKAQTVRRLSELAWSRLPGVTVFHNAGHVGPEFLPILSAVSHLEVESLPTGGWGYMHFPISARYARTLGMEFLGMTGKFSEMWGHFNSYKAPAALEYECFSALALGGKCSVGDQLPPQGVLDPASYELIGSVYAQVEAVEPWCEGAVGIAEIGVLNAEEFDGPGDRLNSRNLGAARMFMEGRHQFDFIDSRADFGKYRVIVAPDVIQLESSLKDKLEAYLASGGALLATYKSCIGLSGFPSISDGADLPFSPDFIRPKHGFAGRPDSDYVMYERGLAVTAAPGAEVFATVSEPYFERSYDKFVSHAHTPPEKTTEKPAVLKLGKVVHLVHPVFSTYANHSMLFHREIVLAALRMLLPEPKLICEAPSTLQATMTRLPDGHEILHFLHYVPERRGERLEVVEDRLPLMNVKVSALGQWDAKIQPQGHQLQTEFANGRTSFEIPLIDGHQIVELTLP